MEVDRLARLCNGSAQALGGRQASLLLCPAGGFTGASLHIKQPHNPEDAAYVLSSLLANGQRSSLHRTISTANGQHLEPPVFIR